MTADVPPTSYFLTSDPNFPFDFVSEFPTLVELVHPDRPKLVEEFLNGKLIIQGEVAASAVIEGPAYIGSGTRIHPGAYIKGPVFIGENCDIGHGAIIRGGSMLANDCVVGHSAEIKNSICFSGAKLQSGIFAGDSVLGKGARLGSGVITANRRFDQGRIALGSGEHKTLTDLRHLGAVIGDNVRLGANVVTSPGAVIGPYTWVGSLVNVYGFIPRAQKILLKQELTITGNAETDLE